MTFRNTRKLWIYPSWHFQSCKAFGRYGAFTGKRIFLGRFPADMVRHELSIIQLCTDLLEEYIDVKQFADKLDILTLEDGDYKFVSSKEVLERYPWEYRQNEAGKKAVGQIRQGIAEIEECLKNKKEWRNIWRIAYGIHNMPAVIYHGVENGPDAGG